MIELRDVLDFITTCDADDYALLEEEFQKRGFELGLLKFCDGKIYGIFHIITNALPYVGSTVKPLSHRKNGHISFWRTNTKSKYTQYIMANGGPQMYDIRLIEAYPCHNLRELLERERYHINVRNPICNIALRGPPAAETKQLLAERKHILKTTSKEERLQAYEAIEVVTHEQFTRMKDTRYDALSQLYWQKEKHVFDIMYQQEQDAAMIFRAIHTDSRYTVRFFNLYLEANPDAKVHVRSNLFKRSVAKRCEGVKAITAICQLSGLANSHDSATVIPHQVLEANYAALAEQVHILNGLGYKGTAAGHKNKQNLTAKDQCRVVKISNAIGVIFSEFSGFSTKRISYKPSASVHNPKRKCTYSTRLELCTNLSLVPRIIAGIATTQ